MSNQYDTHVHFDGFMERVSNPGSFESDVSADVEETYVNSAENLRLIHDHGIDILNREVYLAGGSDDEIDFSSTLNFIKNVRYLDSISNLPITIFITSVGGDVNYGFAIYDTIKSLRSKTICVTTGIAASMGTILVQATDLRLITPHTVFLIHEGSICLDEMDAKTAGSTINSMKLSVKKFYEIYLSRCKNSQFFHGKSERQVKTVLKKQLMRTGDWYLEADDIIKHGFADTILNNISELEKIKAKLS